MASEKLRRENVTDEPQIHVDKDRVPKITSHFESLAEKVKGSDIPGGIGHPESGEVGVVAGQGGEVGGAPGHDQRGREEGREGKTRFDSTQFQSPGSVVGNLEFSGVATGKQKEAEGGKEEEREMRKGEHGEKPRAVGKFEVSEEEDKGKAEGERREKEMERKEESGDEQREGLSLDEISKYRQTAQQSSMDALRAAEERYNKAKEPASSALQNVKESAGQAKDTVAGGLQKTSQYVSEKGGAVKDTAMEKGHQGYVAAKETAQQAKEYASEKASGAKDCTAQTVPSVAGRARDVTVDTAKKIGSYAGEKAVSTKDVALKTGKTVAGEVKDRAVVAGWGAAHFTCEKTVEATKAVAGVTKGVAGYTGQKAVAAKDAVAHAGQRAMEYTGQKVAATKDSIVATEESATEYAARKKAEAERELEAKKSAHAKEEGGGKMQEYSAHEAVRKPDEAVQQMFEGAPEHGKRREEEVHERRTEQGSGGLLQAIGETIVEIAQTTKELVVGGEDEAGGAQRHRQEEGTEAGAGKGIIIMASGSGTPSQNQAQWTVA
ncbi:seed biotin-containing protein SBP65 [Diospyros lotus]|uniref:seed biotin-containing protein SBP65 n=1 Tax=Diospyros lotus TaxID=55363 RepID=UPI0022557FC7|nr:seed biotin-containing protein SBP65 [Diospyros lotus]